MRKLLVAACIMESDSTHGSSFPCFVRSLALILLFSQSITASDWPAFRHDVRRSAVSKDTLKFPLKLAWHRKAKLPPQPAFADPVKHPTNIDFAYFRDGAEPVQLDFDHAFHPVSANATLILRPISFWKMKRLQPFPGSSSNRLSKDINCSMKSGSATNHQAP